MNKNKSITKTKVLSKPISPQESTHNSFVLKISIGTAISIYIRKQVHVSTSSVRKSRLCSILATLANLLSIISSIISLIKTLFVCPPPH